MHLSVKLYRHQIGQILTNSFSSIQHTPIVLLTYLKASKSGSFKIKRETSLARSQLSASISDYKSLLNYIYYSIPSAIVLSLH